MAIVDSTLMMTDKQADRERYPNLNKRSHRKYWSYWKMDGMEWVSGTVWWTSSNIYFHILNNFTYISNHFFTCMYIKNTQTTLLKLFYQTCSKWKKKKTKTKTKNSPPNQPKLNCFKSWWIGPSQVSWLVSNFSFKCLHLPKNINEMLLSFFLNKK